MSTQTVVTEKMVFGGDCIAKNDGKMIFIPFAIPGEKLEVEIVDSKRDYDVANIVNILEPSEHRTNPVCPLYGKCGGCNTMHIDFEYQRELRTFILQSCFERENIEVPKIEAVFGSETGYRNRFQFHDGGISMRQSNKIVNLENCPIACKEINEWLLSVPQNQRPKGRVHVFAGDCIIPELNTAAGILRDKRFPKVIVAEQIQNKIQQETVIKAGRRKIKKTVNHYFSGTVLNPANTVTVKIADKTICFDVQGFFQSNIEVLEKTAALVCKGLKGKNVLDMYSGAGTFSVFLADCFEKVTLVEHNRDALVFAEINMQGKPHTTYGFSGAKWVAENADSILKTEGEFDTVVIDPPRSGMEKEVCSWICKNHPLHIRSVSCDPATHARDAARLIKAGYKLSKLYLLDFYPQTSHIESLAYFDYQF